MHNLRVHRALGHVNSKRIKLLEKLGLCPKRFILRGNGKIPFCETCVSCKGKRPSVKKKTCTRASQRGGRVFTDLKSIETISYGGHKYAIHFIDDATRYAKTYFLKMKCDAHLALRKYIKEELEPNNIILQALRYDGGTEYSHRGDVYSESSDWRDFIASKPQGVIISVERTPTFTPEMNGVVERYSQTIMNETRTIIHDQNRSEKLWPLAMRFSQRIHNMMPTAALEGSTPWKEWHAGNAKDQVMPDTNLWKIPLCTAYAFDERKRYKTKALHDRREKLIYAGESKHSPCYLLLRESTGQLIERRYKTVIFDTNTDASRAVSPADGYREVSNLNEIEWSEETSAALGGIPSSCDPASVKQKWNFFAITITAKVFSTWGRPVCERLRRRRQKS